MSTASDEWIQASLAGLETLEQRRQAHESALEAATDAATLQKHSQALEQIEDEMRNLYERLDAVASDEDDEDSSDESFELIEASAPRARLTDAPRELAPERSDSFDSGEQPKKRRMWGVALALVLGGGALGGYLFVTREKPAPPPPAPVAPPRIIRVPVAVPEEPIPEDPTTDTANDDQASGDKDIKTSKRRSKKSKSKSKSKSRKKKTRSRKKK
jgi:uncharacterized coiled-coil protein SlyX